MAKESGLGMTLSIDDSAGNACDIASCVTDINFSTPQGLQDITGLDKSAVERLILLSDGSVQVNGVFDDAASKSHVVFKTRTGTRTVAIGISGQTLSMEMLIDNVTWQRAASGEFTFSASLQLQSGTVPVWT